MFESACTHVYIRFIIYLYFPSNLLITFTGGWVKRAKGTAFGRTVEVWRFAFSFLFKFLKVNKLKKSKEFLAGDKA